ncbi:hypothetical protein HOLleu_23441 [Holothuria leucospilota]|uniref:Sushi domain-containing protein n=1 Tax=Holothuria leucospilota TaxID=206669 RepID=A0A9Q1BV81_HOLLE|nr:hypothetical protein HOLleu_23441 [Holothuria leucospilota]
MNTFTICLIIWASDKLTRLGRCQDVTNEYIGCYEDGPTDDTRIFKEYGKYLPQWNPTECRKECLSHNLFYYGISQKCMCFCGNSSSDYTQYGKSTERECENRCTSSPPRIKVFEVQCPRLELKNGDVRISHTIARFICRRGFVLFGQDEINCIYRNNTIKWDGQQPSCVGVTSVVYTIAHSTSVTSTEVSATLTKHFTPSTSRKTSSIASEETAVETTTEESQTTHQSTSVLRFSLTSTEDSTEHYLNKTILSTSFSTLSSNVTANFPSTPTVNSTSSGKVDERAKIVQLFLHLLIAVLPVIIIFFFILLSCCCTFDDRKYRKRKSLGDTTCGPSSFEFMTPRVIKRQFSASTLPMTYNRSFGMYNSKPELDCDGEIDPDDDMETEYEGDNIYFELTADSNDNRCEEDGIIYV